MHRLLTIALFALGALLLATAGVAAGKSPDGCAGAHVERGHLNRLEHAATPEPFACFALHDGKVKGDKEKFDLYLGAASDGIDPASERILISVGGDRHVFEAGALVPHGNKKWRFESKTGAVRKLELKGPGKDGRIEVKLDLTKHGPGFAGLFLLRIGNDWGGLDLASGERVDGAPALNAGAAASAVIGAGGGAVTAGGFTLTVPAGALAGDTTLTLTPFADGSGVRLEPHGLQFAVPATLGGGPGGPLALLTSPLSGLPLYAGPDGAVLWHFSDVGEADPEAVDFVAWADALLAGAGQMTVSELQGLLGLAEFQQSIGCTSDCIDLAELATQISAAVTAAATASCQTDVDAPTDAAVGNWLALAAAVEAIGGDGSAARACAESIFGELVAAARAEAILDPTDEHLDRLLELWQEAALLGINEEPSIEAIEASLRSMITRYAAVCESDPATGQVQLQRGLDRVGQLGESFPGVAQLRADFESQLARCNPAREVETFGVSVNGYDTGIIDSRCSVAAPREGWTDAQPLPRTVVVSGCGGSASMTVTEFVPGRYEIRISGGAAETYTNLSATLTVKVSPGPMTVRVTQTAGALAPRHSASVQLGGDRVLSWTAPTYEVDIVTMDEPWVSEFEVEPAEPGEPFSRAGLGISVNFSSLGGIASELVFEVEFLTR